MKISWCVEVTLSNGKALAIGTDYVSGSADLTESDEELIREAGKSLLAFVGESTNKKLNTDAFAWECNCGFENDRCNPTICRCCGERRLT